MKVFIMGMHRSGTSLVTGLLYHCGLYLGNNLLMHARDNPKGHFEDRKFININNTLLLSNGGHWKRPPEKIMANPQVVQKAKRFLSSWPRDRIVGFKDPRICLTFPFWHRLIDSEPIKVVFVHRPAPEIASSLKKRNGMPKGMGLKLAKIYDRRAEENIKNTGVWAYDVYFHDFLMIGWKIKLCYLCSILGLDFPKDLSKIERFIDDRLWHHREGANG